MKPTAIALLTALALGTSSYAQGIGAPFVVAETQQGFGSLQEAVDAIGDARGTIVIAPGTYKDCAVQQTGDVSYQARTPGSVVFDGGICEGKATLVLKGRGARVDGLVFQNLFIEDGNGAGIRLQSGNLAVTRAIFRNSQEGILTHDDPAASISIDRSTFRRLGRCDGDQPCAHSIYVGDYGLLSVTNSRFDEGTGGHYVKTRSARVQITANSFDDSRGSLTNYMIDLANGSSGLIAGNEMEQGQNKDNYSLFISVAPEGRDHSSVGLVVRDNIARFSPGVDRRSAFVANWTNDAVAQANNVLAPGIVASEKR